MALLGQFDVPRLVAQVERFAKQRGVRQLRELAPITDPGSESFGESALRRRWYAGGLPRPRTQIPILRDGAEIYRLDLGLDVFGGDQDAERRLVLLFDRARETFAERRLGG